MRRLLWRNECRGAVHGTGSALTGACVQEADTGPLSPMVFAMALLPPMAGQEHAPSALRHLMDPGSPIADMYTLCSECEGHLEASKQARLQLTQVPPAQSLTNRSNTCSTPGD